MANSPLNFRQPIVDEEGRPTPSFLRRWQESVASIQESVASIQALAASAPVKAWVNFNGNAPVAIQGSLNVSSITRHGAGDYTVHFTKDMPDANYAVSLAYTPEVAVQHTVGFIQNISKGSCRVAMFNAKNSADTVDKAIVCVTVMGN